MRRTNVKENLTRVKHFLGGWDDAIAAIGQKLAIANERVKNLKDIRQRFASLKESGEPWPSTQN